MSTLTNPKRYLGSQLFTALPVPTTPFTNQTIIVTGANTGLDSVAEAWELDLSRHGSIESFARRAARGAGPRGRAGRERGRMREAPGGKGVVTFKGSFTHWMTRFPERTSGRGVFAALADGKRARMRDRYYVSKLIQLLIVREFANELAKSTKPGKIITSIVNPGFVATKIMRHEEPLFQVYLKLLQKALSRTPEEGSRTLVHGAGGGEETHGQSLNDCKVGIPSAFVLSPEGEETQKQLWRELAEKLERIHPEITQNI